VPTWNAADFDPHDPTFLADPYPTYANFRQSAPVYRVNPYGSLWVFRYADVKAVLSDTNTFLKNPPAGQGTPLPGPMKMMEYLPEPLFQADPPRHTMLRDAINPLFADAIMAAEKIANDIATPIIEKASATGYIELVADYAIPVPAGVLFTILGIPQDTPVDLTWPGLTQWTEAIATAHDITQSLPRRALGGTCDMALYTFYEGLVAKCQAEPQSGLVGAMCATIGQPGGLQAVDAEVCATDLTIAGYLSTTFLIGTGVRNLIRNPDQAQLLRETPDLTTAAVKEMLRFDAPAQLTDRFAAVDTELSGTTIPAGSKVTAVIGSANHDPDVFNDAETFLIQRDNADLLTFGEGIHRCIGEPLVYEVAPVAIGLLARKQDLQINGLEQWQTDPYLRAVSSLPIKFSPA
jgi:cytochrome P450